MKRLRSLVVAAFRDAPRLVITLRAEGPLPSGAPQWVGVRNHYDTLSFNERGAMSNWRKPSELIVARVFPGLGLQLMRRAFRDWPFVLADAAPPTSDSPDVSVVFSHRGLDRLPNLIAAIRNIAAQEDVLLECIVVEQSASPEVQEHLPAWVRYAHAPSPTNDFPFCKSWATNVGARMARGRVLILQDNDLIGSPRFAREVLDRIEEGADFVDLKRFIFHLDKASSRLVTHAGEFVLDRPPEQITQSVHGGGVAARSDAYSEIGGCDETFVGWGGEDVEFWNRAHTMKVDEHGYLPFLHLWHSPQPDKKARHNAPAVQRWIERKKVPRVARITELRARDWGNPAAPAWRADL